MNSRWSRFWFCDESYFDLAFLRILLVTWQLFFLFDAVFAFLTHIVTLPVVLYHPDVLLRLVTWPWGWSHPPSANVVFAGYGVTLLAGVGALFGLRTNLCMFVFATGSILLQCLIYSFVDFHHTEAVLLLSLLALSLGPCGKVLSIDSLIARRKGNATQSVPLLDYRGPYAGWPVKFAQCLFPLIYLSAVTAKLAYNGYSLDWANGYTLQYYLLQDSIRKPDMELGLWASQFHWPILISQVVVIAYQLTYVLVIPYRRLRWIYLPLGLVFHIGNYLLLRAPFPAWIVLLTVYVPWSEAFKMLAAARVEVPAEPVTPAAGTGQEAVHQTA
jgi:hypothetical protein